TITYTGNPAAAVQKARASFAIDAFTIVQAWKQAGRTKQAVPPIASYGEWTDYGRQPLMWLGLPDPASSLIDQMRNDPDAENLEVLLAEWHRKHGDKPVTIRRLVDDAYSEDLHEALMDLPVVERGTINRS